MKKEEIYIHITSARGPVECELGVAKIVSEILREARSLQLVSEIVHYKPGEVKEALESAIIKITGKDVSIFTRSWTGTVLWIVQSPYRKNHKRKNWFIGISVLEKPDHITWNEKDVSIQTMRASGAGGQHVNKTESAIRATHIPAGIQVTVSTSRSQHSNRKEAMDLLKQKLLKYNHEDWMIRQQEKWKQHYTLNRGNAIRTYEGMHFKRLK